MIPTFFARCHLLAAICLPLLAGCGSGERIPDLVPVQGTVTVNGSPGSNLTVSFIPTGQTEVGTSVGTTDSQGKYALRYKGRQNGAPAGNYRVTIQQVEVAEIPEEEQLPARYNDETVLTAEVTSEPKSYDFALETR